MEWENEFNRQSQYEIDEKFRRDRTRMTKIYIPISVFVCVFAWAAFIVFLLK